MSYSGKYQVKNKNRYRGDVSKVTYRSLWELHMMKWLDNNDQVEFWSSETTVIPYFSEADQKNRRYFMDFTAKINGTIHLWEVKPAKQTQPPVKPSRLTTQTKKRFMDELYTWQTNLSKWKATKKLSDKKGWKFKILTEHTLRKNFGMRV